SRLANVPLTCPPGWESPPPRYRFVSAAVRYKCWFGPILSLLTVARQQEHQNRQHEQEQPARGVFFAAVDLNGDGVIAGGGPGGGPRVFALSGKDLTTTEAQTQVANFFAGDIDGRGSVRVGVKNLDGDGNADLVVGSGANSVATVTAYLGKTISVDGT